LTNVDNNTLVFMLRWLIVSLTMIEDVTKDHS